MVAIFHYYLEEEVISISENVCSVRDVLVTVVKTFAAAHQGVKSHSIRRRTETGPFWRTTCYYRENSRAKHVIQ